VGASTARFAPSIMTPPYGWALVHPLHANPSVGGGSKPPPYGASTARFAPSIMTPTVRMGFSPSTQLAYLSNGGRKNPHRTDGLQSIRCMPYTRALAVGASPARFAPSIMTPTVRMGLGPSAQLAYLSNRGRKNPHRTAGISTCVGISCQGEACVAPTACDV